MAPLARRRRQGGQKRRGRPLDEQILAHRASLSGGTIPMEIGSEGLQEIDLARCKKRLMGGG